MRKTIFDHPILMGIMSFIAGALLKLNGWTVVGKIPDLPKSVVIGAPHTSNWDFVVFVHLVFYWKSKVFWMGKSALFKGWRGPIMRWIGGVPVDRSKSMNLVDQMVEAMNESERMTLLITPEGTRSQVRVWKSGFYHIAQKVGVPIFLGFADFPKKIAGVGETSIMPSGDYETDMKQIIEYYRQFEGKRPELGLAELEIRRPEESKDKEGQ
jgi:1-acyl-sn-glycerol-3-phosphate acyltransferase